MCLRAYMRVSECVPLFIIERVRESERENAGYCVFPVPVCVYARLFLASFSGVSGGVNFGVKLGVN